MTFQLRNEKAEDFGAIDQLNDLAFGETAQSRIIRQLRKDKEVLWSKVLLNDSDIVGHLLFYRVLIDQKSIAAGLGPIAIHPELQKQGLGSRIIKDGLAQCNPERHHIVFLLGHTSYYPRFGFSSELGAKFISPWPRPAFMGLQLNPNAPKSGTLTFPKAYL